MFCKFFSVTNKQYTILEMIRLSTMICEESIIPSILVCFLDCTDNVERLDWGVDFESDVDRKVQHIHRRDENGMLYAALQEVTNGSKKLHPLHNNRYM